MDIGKHHTKLEKCVFVINSNDVVLWIHLFWLGPVLFHFMKLIEFLMRLSKRTNELIKNWQMGLYSAVLGILPLCVYVKVHNASCQCVCVCCGWPEHVWFYNDVLECMTLSEILKSWNEFSDSNMRKIITQQNVIVLFHTHDLFIGFLSALYQHRFTAG